MTTSNEFEQMPSSERIAIPQERRSTTFTAKRETLGFENVERDLSGHDVTQRFTTPPSPVILDSDNFGRAFLSTSADWRGRWIRFFLLTYLHEGEIWFRKIDEQAFEVQVTFE